MLSGKQNIKAAFEIASKAAFYGFAVFLRKFYSLIWESFCSKRSFLVSVGMGVG